MKLSMWKRNQFLVLIIAFMLGYLLAVIQLRATLTSITTDVEVDSDSETSFMVSQQRGTKEEFIDNVRRCAAKRSETCAMQEIRVFCWILTVVKNIELRAAFVNRTWAQHCDGHVFVVADADAASLQTDAARSMKVLNIPGVTESRATLYQKTRRSLEHLATSDNGNILRNYGWFLKADDDTFVVVENLKTMLIGRNADDPAYFGRHFKLHVDAGYNSGGAGYVLSRGALKRYVERNAADCSKQKSTDEDVELGRCMETLQVPVIDSRDGHGRQRFHPREPLAQFTEGGGSAEWQPSYDKYPTVFGVNCCANTTVTFHYVPGPQQLMIHHFVHKMSPSANRRGATELALSLLNECVMHVLGTTGYPVAPSHSGQATLDSSQSSSSEFNLTNFGAQLLQEVLALDKDLCEYSIRKAVL